VVAETGFHVARVRIELRLQPAETASVFLKLFLCLSRACLGKMIVYRV
jgi:hypothetical protein